MKKYKNSKRKAFTLIEMLVVIAIIGIILIIVIPSVSSVLNNKDNKLYQTHMLTVEAATKTYIDQNKGQLNEINSSCFNIDYKLLLKENLKESDIRCNGNIIISKSQDTKSYNPSYYLTCTNLKGEIIHKSESKPVGCKGFDGRFNNMKATIYTDSNYANVYDGTYYVKNAYVKFESTSPYSSPISHYEYATSLDDNWSRIDNNSNLGINEQLKNYVGTIYFRSVDEDGNTSSNVENYVKLDNTGPTFSTSVSGNCLVKRLNIFNVSDTGVKTLAENAYSYDGGNTWVKEMSKDYTQNTTVQVCSRDSLDNRSCKTVVISGIDMMDPTVSVSVAKKAAIFTFGDDMGIAGYGVNQSSVNEPDWISSTNTIATWTASSAGTYYVWVKDVAGKIGKAAFTIDQNAFCAYTPGASWEYNYTGDVQTFAVPCNGTYKLEVYGAQGGYDKVSDEDVHYGGNGGYASGSIELSRDKNLYIAVGGKGEDTEYTNTHADTGGYNGGAGSIYIYDNYEGGGGGGATHIATANRGVLSNYKNNKNEVLVVAGGGGGGSTQPHWYENGEAMQANNITLSHGGGLTAPQINYHVECGEADWEHEHEDVYDDNGNFLYSYIICNAPNENRYSHENAGQTSQLGNDDDFGKGANYNCGGGWYGGIWRDGVVSGSGGSSYIGGVNNGTTQSGVRTGNGYAKITLVTINQS